MAPASPSSIKLLIVDDDPMMRLGLTAALGSQADLTIVGEASDGRQGVEQVAALCPDVVLMDVGMPGMDGIAATQAIKAATPSLRVVMLTSHTDDTEVIAALSSGADAYCIKGTDVEALANAIRVAASGAAYLEPIRKVSRHLNDTYRGRRLVGLGRRLLLQGSKGKPIYTVG